MQSDAAPAPPAHLVVVPRGPRLAPPAWSALLAGLPSAEQHRLARLQRWEDRQDSALGWHLLRRLAADLGASVRRTPTGRPVADPPLDVSLSHGGGWVTVATHTGGRVGVDVEGPRATTPALARRCLSAGELDWFEDAPDAAGRQERFLRLWTAKEAYLKATGTGLGRDPRTVALDCSATEPRLGGAEGARWGFRSSNPADGVHLTVCWERDP
ncbi:4'-phosphopantetheinyl transferase [Kineococcus xinjiangensis]|uniref:4'-phosphopantetheinyl transferase n=1 Tax=Kineococcus xinjiangensis TaxID=512762 RepID=A0A2S6IWR9_9ACTN|nr:4'-phosphopantetheinyl transferase superfamily protein [Kineococcus xinjiangensis]PPK98726.1 4'-phosphopantetheinyl transferase [Kineococcus xinjiangensis]